MLKRLLILSAIIAFSHAYAKSQLYKNTWIVGGDVKFSSLNSKTVFGTTNSDGVRKNLGISAQVGYFVEDKFAIGLKPSYGYKSYQGVKENAYAIGPFVRYYFLNMDKEFNILAESSYQLGKYGSSILDRKLTQDQFNFAVGPAVFFNSAIAGEFLVSYFNNKRLLSRNTGLQISVGLQIHLDN